MSFKNTSSSVSNKNNTYEDKGLGRSTSNDSSYKLVLVGDSGVGKSCLLEKLLNESSNNAFISTIGVVIRTHSFSLTSGQFVKLQVWDTGGQERYRPVLSTCYRNAFGVIIVFDVTNRTSFNNLTQWLHEITEYSRSDIPKILIGNKTDLPSRRSVTFVEAKNFAETKSMSYVETSALNATNIYEAFSSLVISFEDARILSQSS